MPDLLCIGGPLNGTRTRDIGRVLYYRLPDPHHYMNVRPQALRLCLELQEIQALTGRDSHRDPGRMIREDMERQQVLIRQYLKRGFIVDGNRVDAYVWEGYEPTARDFLTISETTQPVASPRAE